MGSARSSPALVGPFGRPALRLGRLLGVEVGLDVTWLFVFALITFSLAQRFQGDHESWSAAAAWGGGLAASLLFFASILLHELGHSVTSNALGLPVRSITLFLFGGLASLSGEPKRPRDEFLIGAAGPAVSVVLGAGFLALGLTLPRETPLGDVAASVCSWLGSINLVLAAFNLFPGFPLDGGHLLRAVVWAWTGSLERATRVAAASGSAFALGLIGLGAALALLGGQLLGGLWLVLIGWFVLSAARSSSSSVVLERALGAIAVRDLLGEAPPTAARAQSVAAVLAGPVLRQGHRWLVVRERDEPVGLVTLAELLGVPAEERAATPVGQVMIPRAKLRSIPQDASLWAALRLMQEQDLRQLPVLDEAGGLVGVLTRERLLGVARLQLELASARG